MSVSLQSAPVSDAVEFLEAFAELPPDSQDAVCAGLLQLDGTLAGRAWGLVKRAEVLAEKVANGMRGYDEALRFRAAAKAFAHLEGLGG